LDLSIIIPCYNEAQNIPLLFEELRRVVNSTGLSYEVIGIDDGSQDQTFEGLKKEISRLPQGKAVRLRRNFGQTAALSAGFDLAEGKIIITLDGDLQNDPEDIPKLVAKIQQGYDLVSGWRRPDGRQQRRQCQQPAAPCRVHQSSLTDSTAAAPAARRALKAAVAVPATSTAAHSSASRPQGSTRSIVQ